MKEQRALVQAGFWEKYMSIPQKTNKAFSQYKKKQTDLNLRLIQKKFVDKQQGNTAFTDLNRKLQILTGAYHRPEFNLQSTNLENTN